MCMYGRACLCLCVLRWHVYTNAYSENENPGIQRAFFCKAFIERAFVYMACGMGFGGGSRGFNIALVLVFVMGLCFLKFVAVQRASRERERETGISLT